MLGQISEYFLLISQYEKDDLIYISRAPIPRLKNNNLISIKYKKQVCIYSYFIDELKSFLSYGRKSFIENIEDIEINKSNYLFICDLIETFSSDQILVSSFREYLFIINYKYGGFE